MATLTKKKIDRATYEGDGKSWDVRYDGSVPGFGVRVFPSGVKSFVLRYRTRSGRTRILTLGRFGVLTLEQARDKARRELVKVADGRDPVAERKAERTVSTVKEFAAHYLDKHSKPHKATWKEDERRLDRYVVPKLGHLALADVQRSNVAALHAEIGADAPYEANRVQELVRSMFNKAVEWGHLPDAHPNPGVGVKRFRERARERFVLPSEMPALFKAIDAADNVFIRAAMKLYLLTGLRRSELLRSKWTDIDLEAGEWRVTRKGGQRDTVPVSGPAAAILAELPRIKDNPYVFPSWHQRGKPLTNIDKAWRAARKAAGCEDVTLHDLRRTVGSWLASAGKSLTLIGDVLGHAPGDVKATAIYARLVKDAAREALEEHGRALEAVVNGKPKDPDAEREKRIADLEAELARLRGEAGP